MTSEDQSFITSQKGGGGVVVGVSVSKLNHPKYFYHKNPLRYSYILILKMYPSPRPECNSLLSSFIHMHVLYIVFKVNKTQNPVGKLTYDSYFYHYVVSSAYYDHHPPQWLQKYGTTVYLKT